MGEADELNSHIELVKSMLRQSEILQLLERIQKNLDLIAAGVSNPYDRDCKVSEKETAVLEAETDKLEAPVSYTHRKKGSTCGLRSGLSYRWIRYFLHLIRLLE